ncbi:TetR family transcriptional regulator [Spongiibacter taiwanensis]|uniref:TetR/AcrR family transcriptional regulator n=1 Tax=Spongiibacter taiwanensis TaxID=1748242 RepID=UPI002034CDA0|nr:TetR family transcriptional regulator [Spongiibacter taiwanensis]USA44036.1 TetR family transcriptional regulator [Spongiibacter taiwanensis]
MGRPSKPIISKERATLAALEVIDSEGLDGLSLQRVAKKLGVKAPSLYYHFENKAEMLASVARLILNQAAIPQATPGTDWRETLVQQAIAARHSILLHPNAAPLMLQFFPRQLMMGAYESWIKRYDVKPELQMMVLEGVEKLTFGSALLGAMSRANGIDPGFAINSEKYQHFARATQAAQGNEDTIFEATVRRFLSAF